MPGPRLTATRGCLWKTLLPGNTGSQLPAFFLPVRTYKPTQPQHPAIWWVGTSISKLPDRTVHYRDIHRRSRAEYRDRAGLCSWHGPAFAWLLGPPETLVSPSHQQVGSRRRLDCGGSTQQIDSHLRIEFNESSPASCNAPASLGFAAASFRNSCRASSSRPIFA